jgi:hypothetical protein
VPPPSGLPDGFLHCESTHLTDFGGILRIPTSVEELLEELSNIKFEWFTLDDLASVLSEFPFLDNPMIFMMVLGSTALDLFFIFFTRWRRHRRQKTQGRRRVAKVQEEREPGFRKKQAAAMLELTEATRALTTQSMLARYSQAWGGKGVPINRARPRSHATVCSGRETPQAALNVWMRKARQQWPAPRPRVAPHRPRPSAATSPPASPPGSPDRLLRSTQSSAARNDESAAAAFATRVLREQRASARRFAQVVSRQHVPARTSESRSDELLESEIRKVVVQQQLCSGQGEPEDRV